MRTPTTADLVAEDVRTAVERWLRAAPGTEHEAVVAGPFLEYAKLFDGLPGFVRPVVTNAHVRSLRVEAATDAAALCDCDIVTTSDYRTSVWHSRNTGRITAPLALERVAGGWRVVDFSINGRRMLRTLQLFDESQASRVGDVVLRPRALELARYGTMLVLDIENLSDHELTVERAAVRGKGRIGPLLRQREWASFAGNQRVPARGGRLAAVWPHPQVLLVRQLPVDLRWRAIGPDTLTDTKLVLPFASLPEPSVGVYDALS